MTNQERKIIEQIKQNDLSTSYDLLTVNHSFLSSLYHKLHIAGYYYEEFLSISYVALIKAAQHADLNKLDYFLGYWKKYILHEYLLEKMRVEYKFSVTVAEYSDAKKNSVDIIESFYQKNNREGLVINDSYESVYYGELRKRLWVAISNTLTEENTYILWEIFNKERSMASIAREIGIGTDRVRRRKLRSLNKLRDNEVIQQLARDFYGIPI